MKKISEVLSENFHFLVVKFSVYLNRFVFIMEGHSFKSVLPPIYKGSTLGLKRNNLLLRGQYSFLLERTFFFSGEKILSS